MGYAAGAGALMQLGGTILKGSAERVRRNQLTNIANTPGLDTTGIAGQALAGQEANFGAGSALTDKINRFNQGERSSLLDASIPGYQARKGQELNITDSLLRGEIPQDVQDQLWNSAAGRSLAGGYGGSGMARNLTARDFGLTSLGLQQQGMQNTAQINNQTANLELPDLVSVSKYLGVSPQELIGIRGNERSQKMQMLTGISLRPSGSDIWAKYLNDTGGALMGAGLSGGLGGMGGGGGAGGGDASGSFSGPTGAGGTASFGLGMNGG